MPIMGGEEVYVFLLLESPPFEKYVGSHCYPSTYYNCLPFFFEGKYNDYGAVENCHGELLNSIILPAIKSRLHEMELGENQCHDIEVKKKDFTIEKLFEADHEDRLFLNAWDHFGGKRTITPARLTHIVFKKQVLDKLLDTYTFQSYSEIVPGKNYNSEYSVKDLIKCGEDYIKTFKTKSRIESEFSYFRMIILGHQESRWQNIFQLTGISYDSDNPLLPEIIRQLAIYQTLENFMLDSRRVWIRPSGVGSQELSTTALEIMAEIVLDEAKALKRKIEEY